MIRIDEIYYNVFLPKIQPQPFHCMHWFDPFGSVKFEDLCDAPAGVSSAMPDDPWKPNHDVVRYMFWDQEPLHKDTVDLALSQFVSKYNTGSRHLITSEHNSEFVKYACDTYGFKPHYYFFHGWAALDWYRGYNRSFLITPPSERNITKTFIAPNRIVAGERRHRLQMLYWIFKLGLTNNNISCPAVCPAENISIHDAIKPLVAQYPDIESVFAAQQLPINFANETDHPMHSCWLSLFDECAESLLYLVTETVATGQRHHLTEKTFKPIALGMPFMIVGTQGSLEYLRSYGFKTFGEFLDESYDDISNESDRIKAIAQNLKDIDSLSLDDKTALYNKLLPIIEHNWNHFYGGGFEKVLWDEITNLVKFDD